MKFLLLSFALISSFLFMTNVEAARPCKPIAEACLAAGVVHRGQSNQMIFENCIKPVVYGRGIRGVRVDSSVINACRARLSSR